MVELGSDVPLEKDILKKGPADFLKTWSEEQANKSKQIIRNNSGSTGTLFTVDPTKTLYITGVWLSVSSFYFSATAINYKLNLSDGTVLLEHDQGTSGVGDVAIANKSLSLNYTMPIEVNDGLSVDATNSSAITTGFECGFVGFLIDKRIS